MQHLQRQIQDYSTEITVRHGSNIAAAGVGGGAEGAYKYIVFLDGSTYYCQDAKGNTVSSNTAPVSVIQYALDNLTGGRTWKETVKLKGVSHFQLLQFHRLQY